MKSEKDERRGISAGTATLIAAVITAIVGPLIVYATAQLVERRTERRILEEKQQIADATKRGVASPDLKQVRNVVELKDLGITEGAEGSGCAPFGKLQLCWGNGIFKPRNDPSTPTCDFKLDFVKPFASQPSVTTSMQGRTSGYAYAVYSQEVDDKHITGAGLEVLRRASAEPVVVSYFAIGLPATDGEGEPKPE